MAYGFVSDYSSRPRIGMKEKTLRNLAFLLLALLAFAWCHDRAKADSHCAPRDKPCLVEIFWQVNNDLPDHVYWWLYAQITAESSWRSDVSSPYADGLAQFTEATWQDWGRGSVFDPRSALTAQRLYMGHLVKRHAATLQPLHFASLGYNAGPGWAIRERRACQARLGCNPRRWSRHVEKVCLRLASACRESRHYIHRIDRLSSQSIGG